MYLKQLYIHFLAVHYTLIKLQTKHPAFLVILMHKPVEFVSSHVHWVVSALMHNVCILM